VHVLTTKLRDERAARRTAERDLEQRIAAAHGVIWGAPKLPDSPSNRMDVWKGEVIASTEEELLTGIQR
jgi:hypothetical protein